MSRLAAIPVRVILFAVICGLLIPTPPAETSDTLTLMLFGGESFYKAGSPHSRTFSCPSTQGTFTMTITNGDGAGHNGVASAIIKVNGTTIAGTSDFNENAINMH